MLSFLPSPILGVIVFSLLILNLVFWMFPVYTLILIKVLTWGSWRHKLSYAVARTAQTWASCNVLIWNTLIGIRWDLHGMSELDRNGKYLVTCNHQSWNDILVLMNAFDRRAPFFKFFIKQELIWVPILGLAWWGLDFPFMKRYTPQQIEKNPALKGKDLETTKKACEKYQYQPVTVLNFLEGTRYRYEKHQRMKSPYKNLLIPKAGGLAFALNVLGEQLDAMLDVTIIYPDGKQELWGFVSGKVRHVIVEVKRLDIPQHLIGGDYANDPEFRNKIRDWVSDLWQEKDQRIDELLAETGSG